MIKGIETRVFASQSTFSNGTGFTSAYNNSVDTNKKTIISLPHREAIPTNQSTLWRLASGIDTTTVDMLTRCMPDLFDCPLYYYVYPGYEVTGAEDAILSLWDTCIDITPWLYPNGYNSIFFVQSDGMYFGIDVSTRTMGFYNNTDTFMGSIPILFILLGTTANPAMSWVNLACWYENSSLRALNSFPYASNTQRNTIWLGNFSSNATYSWDTWEDGKVPVYDTDPYVPGGTSDTGGGTGTFDETTEPIPVPDLPITSASDTGFISLYRPDVTQLKALATYLWGAGFDLTTFKKIFADPISAILGLSLVPLSPTIGASASVVIGNINSGVTMPKITSQFIKYSCGSLTIEEYWGGYLDYSPYTRAEIYLPFIGAKPLNIDDIMGKTLSLWYIIDVLSGGCVACLEAGGSVLYQFIGQCACTIPITGRDMSSIINGVIGAATSGLRGLAAGGIGLGALGAVSSVASNVSSMKPHIEKSGSMGGMGGMLGVKTPYIILTRPRQALPANQNIFTGYPSYITTTLGECTGFTVVQDVHLAGFSATDEEKLEIERLLKDGVIL